MMEIDLFKLGFELGSLWAGISWMILISSGLVFFYAMLFFYVAKKNIFLMKFIREQKLMQKLADYKASQKGLFKIRGELE